MDKKTEILLQEFEQHIKQYPQSLDSNGLLNKNISFISQLRHQKLRGAYAGKTAFVISCGPSLKEVWDDNMRDLLNDQLVITIKQAKDHVGISSDFHMFNEVRAKEYEYVGDSTIRLSVSKYQPEYPTHIHYPIAGYKYENALFVTNLYERWSLDKSYQRPWGVGIMFELGMHFPIYLGCRSVVIIGFDMNKKGRYHFYDGSETNDSKSYQVDDEEFGYAHASSKAYFDWAKKKGVDVRLYSPLSELQIPQIDLNKVKGYLTKTNSN